MTHAPVLSLPAPGVGTRLSRLFWSKVTPQPDGCWLWSGHVMPNGYGRTSGPLVNGRRPSVLVHRLVHEDQIGPIPDGMTVDHACHDSLVCTLADDCPHRRCVRPDHLRAMPPVANSMRRWEDRQQAVDSFPGGILPFIAARRAAGDSWRRIALALYDASAGRIDVPEATVRKWAAA